MLHVVDRFANMLSDLSENTVTIAVFDVIKALSWMTYRLAFE
jgi:hypothetical protein